MRTSMIAISMVGGAMIASPITAQTPATIGQALEGPRPAPYAQAHIFPADTIIHDTLWIADTCVHDYGNGNANSGISVFGTLYDLEACDDIILPSDMDLTGVTVDSMTFFGANPADGIDVGVFADLGGVPDNTATHDMLWSPANSTSWTDCIFGLLGVRSSANGSTGVLNAGSWFVRVKPADFTGSGDWYYIVRDAQTLVGGDAHLRDGDNGNGGYGFTSWTSGGNAGFGAGDVGMQIVGTESGFLLSLEGDCPGVMAAYASGATPGGTVAFAWSYSLGEFMIPGGPCAGTWLDLENPRLAAMATADDNGNASTRGEVPRCFCGVAWLQAVDLETCATSNVAGF